MRVFSRQFAAQSEDSGADSESPRLRPQVLSACGFTLVELLVVIASISILAAMLLPALALAKRRGQGVGCMNNTRQLARAWAMYASENHELLAQNAGPGDATLSIPPNGVVPARQSWVLGDLSQASGSANPDLIRLGLLYPYVNDIKAYKCPADPRTTAWEGAVANPGGAPSMRSLSMNCWLNPVHPWSSSGALVPTVFRKMTDILAGPMTWVFVDENPYSINDGFFAVDPNLPGNWPDIPAAYHGDACGITFADGHSELKKWQDSVLLNWRQAQPGSPGPAVGPNSSDLVWFLQRSTIVH